MNTTFALGNGLKVIDLTKPLDPKTESRRCHLIRYNTGGPIPDFHTAMDLTSHLGTILFTGCRVGGTTIESVIKTLLPYFAIILIALLLVTYIPMLSMFLPKVLGLV